MFATADDYDFRIGDGGSFDGCGAGGKFVRTANGMEMLSMDTKWSVAFAFNAVVYTLLTIFTLSLVISAFCWPLVCVGSIGFCITQFAHFAAIICTGIWRFSGDGPTCAG